MRICALAIRPELMIIIIYSSAVECRVLIAGSLSRVTSYDRIVRPVIFMGFLKFNQVVCVRIGAVAADFAKCN
jgi:hypothetical protein